MMTQEDAQLAALGLELKRRLVAMAEATLADARPIDDKTFLSALIVSVAGAAATWARGSGLPREAFLHMVKGMYDRTGPDDTNALDEEELEQ
jgi:hypothetical protein